MSGTAIAVEQLSKRYAIGRRERPDGLRHAIERWLRAPWRRRGAAGREADVQWFWALHGVSFAVADGEVVGIIGRNGAGKSTLLKVLSRITEPTAGRVRVRGRIASLLEVGTGFHPELTGRENVYLNGAILGMTRAEIRRKFDAIAAFAEVDRFLDVPVKRYSSGMQVRLAFAVAAHLEPDILIVDEVLAVGDSAFQKKCLGRMRDVASQEGRTVLFVSHNTGALSHLCSRGIVLESGQVVADTDVHAALAFYLKSAASRELAACPGATKPRIERVLLDEAALREGRFELQIRFSSPFELRPPVGGVTIGDENGRPLIGTNARMHPDGFERAPARAGVLVCRIGRLPLHSGQYSVSVWLGDEHQDYDAQHDVLTFHFASPDFRPEAPPVSSIGPYNVPAAWRWHEREESVSVCS